MLQVTVAREKLWELNGLLAFPFPYLPSLPFRCPTRPCGASPDAASLLAAPASPSRHRLPATPPCPPQSRPRRRAAGSFEPPAPSSVASTSEEVLLSASPFAGPRTWRLLHGGGRHQRRPQRVVRPRVQAAQGDGAAISSCLALGDGPAAPVIGRRPFSRSPPA